MIYHPQIDPVALSLGPLKIYWYGLAYVFGVILGLKWADKIYTTYNITSAKDIFSNFSIWIMLGIVLGGRLGYVIFYDFIYFFNHPLEIINIFGNGQSIGIRGMSFHGGLMGGIIASYLYSKKCNISYKKFLDVLACSTPIGLFFGRLANFINQEIYGNITTMPWGVIFPVTQDNLPRHPTQIYEAFLEGLVLFFITNIVYKQKHQYYGYTTGIFLLGYGIARSFVEFFKDDQIIFHNFGEWIKMGHILTIPMIIIGLIVLHKTKQKC